MPLSLFSEVQESQACGHTHILMLVLEIQTQLFKEFLLTEPSPSPYSLCLLNNFYNIKKKANCFKTGYHYGDLAGL